MSGIVKMILENMYKREDQKIELIFGGIVLYCFYRLLENK